MCVLLIAWKLRDGMPLLVAANRDESRQRASLPPLTVELGNRRVLMPRDQLAGGTWLGVNDAGVSVAITNRADGTFEPERASRGQLPWAALGMSSALDARRMLEERTREVVFNSFNLFCADSRHAWVARWNGSLQVSELDPGAYVLSNAHDLNELSVPEFKALPWLAGSTSELLTSLEELLGDHRGRDGDGYPLCKHGSTYGTVSSAIYFSEPTGGWRMHFSNGNPCTTTFLQYSLRGMVDPSEAGPSAAG